MTAGPRAEVPYTQLDLRHIRRRVRTALELAVVALAPATIVDPLAVVAGLFEAMSEVPDDTATFRALAQTTTRRAEQALAKWEVWRTEHLPEHA